MGTRSLGNCSSLVKDDDLSPAGREGGLRAPQKATRRERAPRPNCSVYFIEPLAWVIQQVVESRSEQGILRCWNPLCGVKIGTFGLKSTYQCSCGFLTSTYFAVEIKRLFR
ncbi:uncharacterized protein [Blastocystis hominis]|uniref:Uncharacterized protein n=1 Tax=Blastocystis hominis TaxID=12968 RepID=D8M2F9_BLAHO|nr:uncharacterized protein [Blastocystis hominis]CBK22248.2 unnamed protein product [Blastocystis hominis]|eukprot:XP_012896296.1 uncharacterized protein [Blastocystis hominis]